MKKKCLSVEGWKLCWHLAAPSLRMRFGSLKDDWRAHIWKCVCVCGSSWWPEAPSLNDQSVFSLDTSRGNVLYLHSNSCISLWLFASSQLKYMFLKRGMMGSWHCHVTWLAWVLVCCVSLNSFPWMLPWWCLNSRQRCILMKCKASSRLHSHS